MSTSDSQLLQGEVVGAFGRHFRVVAADGTPYQAVTRGRRADVACGDQITMRQQSADQCVIEHVLPRRNLVFRSDQFRQKLIAANIDQILIMLAVEPTFSEDLLSRALVAAEAESAAPLIVLNKTELPSVAAARARVAPYQALGYRVIETALKTGVDTSLAALLPALSNKTTVIIGQSGMGKSTLVNLLAPGALIATREISAKLDTGKHTTTAAQMYIAGSARLIDSPGFQEFGLAHLNQHALENAFIEFRPHLGGCKFYNCRHRDEPGCAILAAVEQQAITPSRHTLYQQLLSELTSEAKPGAKFRGNTRASPGRPLFTGDDSE